MAGKSLSAEELLQTQAVPKEVRSEKAVERGGVPEGCIEATFAGTYYHGTLGGFETEAFEETVVVPIEYVEDPEVNPIGLFRRELAAVVIGGVRSGRDLRECRLVSTSKLPDHLEFDERLKWTTDYDELCALAKQIGRKGAVHYIKEDLETGDQTKHSVSVDVTLYPEPHQLRNAIRRCVDEPQAFDREQSRRAQSGVVDKQKRKRNLQQLNARE
jgi:hypothetical protein